MDDDDTKASKCHRIGNSLQIYERGISDDSGVSVKHLETQDVKHHIQKQSSGDGDDVSQCLGTFEKKPTYKDTREKAYQAI